METYKIVFHITDLEKWDSLLTTVSNLLKDMADTPIEIEIIANGQAVSFYDSTTNAETNFSKLAKIDEENIKIVACNNALNAHGVAKETLYPFIHVVPAGVSELVKKQNEGYAYIRI